MNAIVPATSFQPPALAEQRGIAPHQWNALKSTIWRGAPDEMVLTAVDYCKARGLDPIKKPVHIVQTWDSDAGGMVWQIWEGINSHRITAMRTGDYAGRDATEFGPEVKLNFGGSIVTAPQWARVTMYRMVAGQRCPFPGPMILFGEFAATKKGGALNAQWSRRPRYMLEKVAEAAALKSAFPEEAGGAGMADETPDGSIVRIDPDDHVIENDEPLAAPSPADGQAGAGSGAPPQRAPAPANGMAKASGWLHGEFKTGLEACRDAGDVSEYLAVQADRMERINASYPDLASDMQVMISDRMEAVS